MEDVRYYKKNSKYFTLKRYFFILFHNRADKGNITVTADRTKYNQAINLII